MDDAIITRFGTSPDAVIHSLRQIMHLNSGTYRREDLQWWDSSLTALTLEVRSKLNLLAPVHRLPAEILDRIFQEVVLLAGDGGVLLPRQRGSKPVPTRALLTLTHVCQKWRGITIARKSLWRRVDNRKMEQLETFALRSQDQPLSLHLVVPPDRGACDELLRVYGRRIRRLDLTQFPMRGITYPLSRLTLDPVLLECLTVSSEVPIHYPLTPFPEEPEPPLLCGQVVLHLKALAVQPTGMHLPSNHFPHLTHLYLGNLRPLRTGNPVSRLKALLSHTPALKFLHLSDLSMEPTGDQEEDQPSPAVSLPFLRVLACTKSEIPAAMALLEALELPRDALVRLANLFCEYPVADHLPRSISSRALFTSFTRIQLWNTYWGDVQIVAEGPDANGQNEGEPTSGLWIHSQSSNVEADNWTDWIVKLFGLMPLDTIATLNVSVVDHVLLPEILPMMPNLRELYVLINPSFTHLDTEDHCEVLLQELFHALGGSRGVFNPYCSDLRRLAIEIHSSYLWKYPLEEVSSMLKLRAGRLQRPLESFYLLSRQSIKMQYVARCEHPEEKEDESDEDEEDEESDGEPLEPTCVWAYTFKQLVQQWSAELNDPTIVSEIKMVGQADPAPFATFWMSDVWTTEATEAYWPLPDDEKAKHYIPWTPGSMDEGASLVEVGNA
ncbi:hypothetical protein C2E23DRAFT_548666 [Lenzites betulinus]|nr:hypothetical protein C2E23DRAFT_548666 [Lenzites betulinus]